jgi:tRNA A-37 threonylcarbamoyl transferase component Bud32
LSHQDFLAAPHPPRGGSDTNYLLEQGLLDARPADLAIAELPLDLVSGQYWTIAREACEQAGGEPTWSVELTSGAGGDWIRVAHARAVVPGQGWKLHVSATLASAEDVLRHALSVLLSEPISFKLASTPAALLNLNQGGGGMSQIGKFITVYPATDDQAVHLASLLDQALNGKLGPAIPSDRRLRPGSLVYYRYGGFNSTFTQLPAGEVVPTIITPEGNLTPDRRLTLYKAPEWTIDPFVAAEIVIDIPRKRWISGRYLILSTVYASPRGAIYLALNFENSRCCVLKSAPHQAAQGLDGYCAQDRLLNEAHILTQLSPHPAFPTFYDLIEQEGDLYLAMEDIEGETLMRHVGRLAIQGVHVPNEQVIEWGRQLASILGELHARGLAYRDVKPTNVIITTGERLRLIDLELCCALDGGSTHAAGIGTRGYMSRQQASGEHPGVLDDIYGLGALLYFLATGAEPSTAPDAANLLARPIEWLNPFSDPALAAVIEQCLDPEPAGRYSTMQELDKALSAIPEMRSKTPITVAAVASFEAGSEENLAGHYQDLARRLADSICREAVVVKNDTGEGLTWATKHPSGYGMQLRDLNIGAGGVVLALAELVGELGGPWHREVLEQAASHLARTQPLARTPLPGLYVGEAGVGAALLRAGQVLGSNRLVEAAASKGLMISTLPHTSQDLFNGSAGRLRFHLCLLHATGEREHLDNALQAGKYLLTSSTPPVPDELLWEIPPGYDGLSGNSYLGYAHGAAGIGDALLDLFDCTGQQRFLDAAVAAGRWLMRHAIPALDEDAGLAWPSVPGGAASSPFWCHGATGIGRFFLHLVGLDALPGAEAILERASRSAACGARWAGPTLCHGLAGNIELLVDIYAATGRKRYLEDGHELTRLLETMSREHNGMLQWPSDSSSVFTPDYMVGYSGVATCLLRLSAPDRFPQLLSCRRFSTQ